VYLPKFHMKHANLYPPLQNPTPKNTPKATP
jgi:hypothetical protein